ncbi:dynein regulatory complex subunit 2-like [Lycorma delicatula]|uniref:dynein regulatory complex subunit 2-like n=1 Tax=Lycorma delicatula TaxID=130591 RepID=UPI003F515AC0
MEGDKNTEGEKKTEEIKKKLTKEEKRQLKNAKEEAKRLQMAKQEMERELKNTRKLMAERKKEWEKLGLHVAGQDVKDSMDAIWKQFEYTVDKKDWLISELLEDLEAAEEQSKKTFEDNMQQVDELIRIFGKDVSDLQLEYQGSLLNFLEMRSISLESTTVKEMNAADHLKTLLYSVRKKNEEQQYAISGESIAKREEEENKNVSELEVLITNARIVMERIWNEYKTIIEKYKQSTESLSTKVTEMKDKNDNNEKIIRDGTYKTEQLLDEIEKFKEELKRGGIPASKICCLENLRKERAELDANLLTIKSRFRKMKEEADDQLKNLVTKSDKVIEGLNLTHDKGERILSLYKVCTKLEMQDEKEKMYFWPTKASSLMHTASAHRTDFFEMWRFWQLVGDVEKLYKVLVIKRNYLKKENLFLEKVLKRVIANSEDPLC